MVLLFLISEFCSFVRRRFVYFVQVCYWSLFGFNMAFSSIRSQFVASSTIMTLCLLLVLVVEVREIDRVAAGLRRVTDRVTAAM